MNYIGSIAKEGCYIDGSFRQENWTDRWFTEHIINYDGELTDEICERVVKAYNRWQSLNFQISWGGV